MASTDKAKTKEAYMLALANQRAAAQQAKARAMTRANEIKGFGAAAAAGGMFEDTRAVPGFQNAETAQQTNAFMNMITNPTVANLRGATLMQKKIKKPAYQNALGVLSKTSGGYSYGSGLTTSTGATTSNTGYATVL
jgi:hypothetical protein